MTVRQGSTVCLVALSVWEPDNILFLLGCVRLSGFHRQLIQLKLKQITGDLLSAPSVSYKD